MDGEFPTSAGTAKSDCEKQDWLVVSPTRADFVDKHGVRGTPTSPTNSGAYLSGGPATDALNGGRGADTEEQGG